MRTMVRRIMSHIEEQLIDSFDEMIAGVRVSDKQSSFSPTIALNKANEALERVDGALQPAPRRGFDSRVGARPGRQPGAGGQRWGRARFRARGHSL